jgi:TolA-binding protein
MRTLFLVLASVASLIPAAATAQNLDGRVSRLESEMRAVQRKVFPAGAGTLMPEIVAPQATGQVGGTPATSAITDLSSRVTALEQSLATMTNQIEQTGYNQRRLQDQFEAYKRATDAKIAALGTAPTPIVRDETPTPTLAKTPAKAAATTTIEPPKMASVAGVEKPSTGDDAEDAYIYGYRLWDAKKYPEAEAQLKKVVATYPKSRRASYAQNLLGRAYLDEGKPSLASMAFYENYKKMPDGERAPDSLYYLAQALMKLNKPADACKVYGELTDVYGSRISSGMKADVEKGRAAAKCN